MQDQAKRLEYLTKAKAAEDLAFTFAEGQFRQTWLNIAESYRELAQQIPPEPLNLSAQPIFAARQAPEPVVVQEPIPPTGLPEA